MVTRGQGETHRETGTEKLPVFLFWVGKFRVAGGGLRWQVAGEEIFGSQVSAVGYQVRVIRFGYGYGCGYGCGS